VVFVLDARRSAEAQVIRCLQQQEERPKLVLGMRAAPMTSATPPPCGGPAHRQENALDLGVEDAAEDPRPAPSAARRVRSSGGQGRARGPPQRQVEQEEAAVGALGA
jgi:hypothetical protein